MAARLVLRPEGPRATVPVQAEVLEPRLFRGEDLPERQFLAQPQRPSFRIPASNRCPRARAKGDCPIDGGIPSAFATDSIEIPWTAETAFASHPGFFAHCSSRRRTSRGPFFDKALTSTSIYPPGGGQIPSRTTTFRASRARARGLCS